MLAVHLSAFRVDATPPMGHPLCGGWIEPARGVDDPLRALGVILLGMGQPIVLCAVDWCGTRNEATRLWREALRPRRGGGTGVGGAGRALPGSGQQHLPDGSIHRSM